MRQDGLLGWTVGMGTRRIVEMGQGNQLEWNWTGRIGACEGSQVEWNCKQAGMEGWGAFVSPEISFTPQSYYDLHGYSATKFSSILWK